MPPPLARRHVGHCQGRQRKASRYITLVGEACSSLPANACSSVDFPDPGGPSSRHRRPGLMLPLTLSSSVQVCLRCFLMRSLASTPCRHPDVLSSHMLHGLERTARSMRCPLGRQKLPGGCPIGAQPMLHEAGTVQTRSDRQAAFKLLLIDLLCSAHGHPVCPLPCHWHADDFF